MNGDPNLRTTLPRTSMLPVVARRLGLSYAQPCGCKKDKTQKEFLATQYNSGLRAIDCHFRLEK